MQMYNDTPFDKVFCGVFACVGSGEGPMEIVRRALTTYHTARREVDGQHIRYSAHQCIKYRSEKLVGDLFREVDDCRLQICENEIKFQQATAAHDEDEASFALDVKIDTEQHIVGVIALEKAAQEELRRIDKFMATQPVKACDCGICLDRVRRAALAKEMAAEKKRLMSEVIIIDD